MLIRTSSCINTRAAGGFSSSRSRYSRVDGSIRSQATRKSWSTKSRPRACSVRMVVPFFERYVVPFSCKRATFETVPRNSRGDGERRAPCPNGFGRNRKEGLRDESELEGQGTCTSARRGACENPQRPYVGHPCLGMKIWSSPHGDMRDNCLR